MMKKQYKNIYITIVIAMVTVISIMGLPACNTRPKQIPEDTLKEIITEAMITSAIMNKQNIAAVDSIDPYKTLLQKHGYTLADYVSTIEEMAGRKSNPLAQLFKGISEQMTLIAQEADFDYKRKLKYDSTVVKFTRKVLLKIDTTIVGSLKKYNFTIYNPEIGEYELKFNYQSMGSYDYGTKLVKVEQHDNSMTRNKVKTTSYWMDVTYKAKDYSKKFKIIKNKNNSIDSMTFSFTEPSKRKGFKYHKDTSFIKDIQIIFYTPIEEARIEYFKAFTNFPLEIKPYKIDHDFFSKQPLDSIDSIAR